MIYKKEKNLFLMLILSSLFLKLFYAADENKYNSLIDRCFVESDKGLMYPQYILRNQINVLKQKEVKEEKIPMFYMEKLALYVV